jgi:hypothetical protein
MYHNKIFYIEFFIYQNLFILMSALLKYRYLRYYEHAITRKDNYLSDLLSRELCLCIISEL